MNKADQAKKLEAAGFKAVIKDHAVFVYDGSRYLGYLKAEDDGSTGTCKNVQRAGAVATALRAKEQS